MTPKEFKKRGLYRYKNRRRKAKDYKFKEIVASVAPVNW